jgi:arginine-tRNA-protein transferase
VHNDESVESEDDFSLLETMETQMYTNTESSVEILVREESGNLVGFGILDIGEKNVSSVYNVYDPDYRVRGLGTFMILKSLEWAILEEGLEYLHLGLWIPGHPKMHYKKNFGPGEVLHPLTRSWTQFNSNDWI